MIGTEDPQDALLTLAFSIQANIGCVRAPARRGVSDPSGVPTVWGVLEDLTSRVAHLLD